MTYFNTKQFYIGLAVGWRTVLQQGNVLAQFPINWVGADGADYNVGSNWGFRG